MKVPYKNYSIEIVDDSNYTLNSTDNIVLYSFEYFEGSSYTDRVYPSSKHGIRISKDGKELTSAIICELGGATGIHENSFLIMDDTIWICCSDKVYSMSIPELKINWTKRIDPATCFAIYSYKGDFIIHGELFITRIDKEGNEKWNFGARDIFVTPDGKPSVRFLEDKIILTDWEGYEYRLNENGVEEK